MTQPATINPTEVVRVLLTVNMNEQGTLLVPNLGPKTIELIVKDSSNTFRSKYYTFQELIDNINKNTYSKDQALSKLIQLYWKSEEVANTQGVINKIRTTISDFFTNLSIKFRLVNPGEDRAHPEGFFRRIRSAISNFFMNLTTKGSIINAAEKVFYSGESGIDTGFRVRTIFLKNFTDKKSFDFLEKFLIEERENSLNEEDVINFVKEKQNDNTEILKRILTVEQLAMALDSEKQGKLLNMIHKITVPSSKTTQQQEDVSSYNQYRGKPLRTSITDIVKKHLTGEELRPESFFDEMVVRRDDTSPVKQFLQQNTEKNLEKMENILKDLIGLLKNLNQNPPSSLQDKKDLHNIINNYLYDLAHFSEIVISEKTSQINHFNMEIFRMQIQGCTSNTHLRYFLNPYRTTEENKRIISSVSNVLAQLDLIVQNVKTKIDLFGDTAAEIEQAHRYSLAFKQ